MSALLSLALAGAVQLSAQTPSSQIVNMSTRGDVGQDFGTLISGFVIDGTMAKTVLIRGVGPSLAALDVTDPAVQVNVAVYDTNGNVVAANDGYQTAANADAVAATSATVGAFTISNSGDSALLATLTPGAYTVEVAAGGDGSTSGNALLEIYDVDALTGNDTGNLIANSSSRGMTGPNTDSLIEGFVIAGNANMNLLVRGVGPDLSNFGITDPSQSVGVTIYDANGNVVSSNAASTDANPDGQMSADIGAFPLTQPGDSAVSVSLAPGAYTVEVTPNPAALSAGVALLEVYDTDSVSAPDGGQ